MLISNGKSHAPQPFFYAADIIAKEDAIFHYYHNIEKPFLQLGTTHYSENLRFYCLWKGLKGSGSHCIPQISFLHESITFYW